MRFTISIDQLHSQEWGLNANQSALFSIIFDLSSWAKPITIENEVYYFASRNMIIKEIPLFYSKSDTVYRAFLLLEEKDLIKFFKLGNKDLVKITEKGKYWNDSELGNKSDNSEINPNELGNKSEYDSEINPTNKNTINYKNTNLSWRDDFEIYKDGLREVHMSLLKDSEWMEKQELYNPGVDIRLTLEKACVNFWATQAGWRHKKKQRSKEIDWKSTLTNSLSQSINRVYKIR